MCEREGEGSNFIHAPVKKDIRTDMIQKKTKPKQRN